MNRTTEGLRTCLFDELEGFLAGKFDSQHVQTVTRASGAILATVAKDLEAMRMLAMLKDSRDQPRSIADLHLNLMLARPTQSEQAEPAQVEPPTVETRAEFVFDDEVSIEVAVSKSDDSPAVQPEPTVSVFTIELDKLPLLSGRTKNVLRAYRIKTVAQLISKRADTLLSYRGFGDKCLSDVRNTLAEHALCLKGDKKYAVLSAHNALTS